MFSHWSRPQLDLATHAVQEVVHRKQNLSTRGCVILYMFRRKLVDNLLCLYEVCKYENCLHCQTFQPFDGVPSRLSDGRHQQGDNNTF